MDARGLFTRFETRRLELGMSRAALANRSGVSLPTIQRILSGEVDSASVANVLAIAQTLGMSVEITPLAPSEKFREQQAIEKARRLVAMVQGTSGLEGQAVDSRTVRTMQKRTMHELLAGSGQRLWSE